MTAPVYKDKDKVNGWSKVRLQALSRSPEQTIQDLACIGLKLWDARDSARKTAAAQDEVIQRATIVMMKLGALQKLGMALSETMAGGDISGQPFSQTMQQAYEYVSSKGDGREAIGERLQHGWQTLQEIEITTAKVLEVLEEAKV